MKNEISIHVPAIIKKELYSPLELELGNVVSAERPERTSPSDLRIVTYAGMIGLTNGLLFAAKSSTNKLYYKLPTGTLIKLMVK
jgi:hypothetical protein